VGRDTRSRGASTGTTASFPNGKNLRLDDTDSGQHDVVPGLDFS